MSPVPEDDKNRDDPEKTENVENLEVPQYTLNIGTSSDSDDEEDGHNGYQLLPQVSNNITFVAFIFYCNQQDDPICTHPVSVVVV